MLVGVRLVIGLGLSLLLVDLGFCMLKLGPRVLTNFHFFTLGHMLDQVLQVIKDVIKLLFDFLSFNQTLWLV
jgi:hypothetical protein